MTTQYPSAIITWVDRVDNVNYNYAGDINSAIAEIQGLATDLVGVGGTAGGLAQGGASFYARWTAQHTTAGAHKSLTTDTINASGLITASGGVSGNVTGNLTGDVTGNVSGSSGSCTGNSATATTAAACSGNTAGSSGSCTGNSATATTVTAAAQPAITSVGILTSMTSSGAVQGATVRATGAFGCNSKAAQTAYASGGMPSLTATGFQNNPAGLGNITEVNNLITLITNIRAALVANGIMS